MVIKEIIHKYSCYYKGQTYVIAYQWTNNNMLLIFDLNFYNRKKIFECSKEG